MRQFLDIGSYYRRFIQNNARRAKPLQRRIPQDADFVWGGGQEKGNNLAIIKTALVKHPDLAQPFYIACDASNVGQDAALHQRDAQNKEYPFAFACRTSRPNEREWTITELKQTVTPTII